MPSINTVKRLADALGVQVARLFADVPVHKAPDQGWAGKMGAMIREMSPKKRAKVLRVLKSIVEID